MRKITFLLALCLISIGLPVTAQDTDLYPVNFDKDGVKTRNENDRNLTSVTLSSPVHGSQTLTMENEGKNNYYDLTTTTWKATTGEPLSVSFTLNKGSWIHGYVYIDTDNDGFTATVNSSTHFPEGDLFTYSFYSGDDLVDESGWNSKGESLIDQARNVLNPPSFTAPTTPGIYRMRLKTDWNSIDPAGDINTKDGTFIGNGGTIVDVMLEVVAQDPWCIDRTGWTVIAQNELPAGYSNEGGSHPSGPANKMIDGDADSYWHSDWRGPNPVGKDLPQAFTIDLGSEQNIAGFTYLPRPGNGNGTWLECKMYVSNTSFGDNPSSITIPDETVTPFITTSFTYNAYNEQNRVLKTATSPTATRGRYILLVVTQSHTVEDNVTMSKYGSCAEFNLLNGAAAGKSEDEVKLNILIEAIKKAKAALAKTGVGYPTADAAARTTLSEAIANVNNAATLNAATTAYKSNTTDIQMPEDGKAYTLTAVLKNGTRRYMNYTSNGYELVTTPESDNSNYPMTATLVCHKMDDNGHYIFTNNDGKFFIWRGKDAGHNSHKGYMDAYESQWCDLTVSKLMNGGNVAAGSQDKLFGYMAVQGLRSTATTNSDGTVKPAETDYFVIKANGYDQANAAFYNDTYSSAILIEEKAYPNKPELRAADGIEGIEGLATFSAPFATVVPTGVTAWYATDNYNETEGWISMAQLATAGEAIPANQGVILTGATGQVTMIPATDETQGTVTGNLLGNSAGADKELDASAAYILANLNSTVAFYALDENDVTLGMNKAYLDLSSLSATTNYSVKMNFGGNVSGIQAAGKADDPDAPVYDLSGRRVTVASKGGVYIRNGKKFIVK